MNAKAEAKIRVKIMLARIPRGARPRTIILSDYADETTFDFLLINPGWSFEEWRAVNHEAARLLESHGFTVNLVQLDMEGYFNFLARYNLENTPANRAQYVSWTSVTGPKPDPLPD